MAPSGGGQKARLTAGDPDEEEEREDDFSEFRAVVKFVRNALTFIVVLHTIVFVRFLDVVFGLFCGVPLLLSRYRWQPIIDRLNLIARKTAEDIAKRRGWNVKAELDKVEIRTWKSVFWTNCSNVKYWPDEADEDEVAEKNKQNKSKDNNSSINNDQQNKSSSDLSATPTRDALSDLVKTKLVVINQFLRLLVDLFLVALPAFCVYICGFRWKVNAPEDDKKKEEGTELAHTSNNSSGEQKKKISLYAAYFNAFHFQFQKKILWNFLVLLITLPFLLFYAILALCFWRNVFRGYFVKLAHELDSGASSSALPAPLAAATAATSGENSENPEDPNWTPPTAGKAPPPPKKADWPRPRPWPISLAVWQEGLVEMLVSGRNKLLLLQQLSIIFVDLLFAPFIVFVVFGSGLEALFSKKNSTTRWQACKNRFYVWSYSKVFTFHG